MKMSEAAILIRQHLAEEDMLKSSSYSIYFVIDGEYFPLVNPVHSKITVRDILHYMSVGKFNGHENPDIVLGTSRGMFYDFTIELFQDSLIDTSHQNDSSINNYRKDTNGLSEEATKAFWNTVSGIVIQNPTISISETYLIGLRDLCKRAQKVLEE